MDALPQHGLVVAVGLGVPLALHELRWPEGGETKLSYGTYSSYVAVHLSCSGPTTQPLCSPTSAAVDQLPSHSARLPQLQWTNYPATLLAYLDCRSVPLVQIEGAHLGDVYPETAVYTGARDA